MTDHYWMLIEGPLRVESRRVIAALMWITSSGYEVIRDLSWNPGQAGDVVDLHQLNLSKAIYSECIGMCTMEPIGMAPLLTKNSSVLHRLVEIAGGSEH